MTEGPSSFPPPLPWEREPEDGQAARPPGDLASLPTWPPHATPARRMPPTPPSLVPPDAASPDAASPRPFVSRRPTTGQGDRSARQAPSGGWGWAPGRSVATSGLLAPFESWVAGAPQAQASQPYAKPAAEEIGSRANDLRELADLPTQPSPAMRRVAASVPLAPPARAVTRPRPRTQALKPWLVRLALAATLVALGLRADLNSLAFMSPGGAIAGWTNPPAPKKLFTGLPPATQPNHVLTPTEYAAELVPLMSLDAELGQMIMIQYYSSDITPDLSTMIATDQVGGVLLLGRGVAASDQAMNAQLQQLAGNQLLVSIDQEGGPVNRFLGVAGPAPSASSLTTPEVAQSEGAHDARLLHQYGFNLNLAPIVDVGAPDPIGQFVGRTFSEDPQQVAALAGAYLDGLQSDGTVTSVLKHFPGGIEATYQDPHTVMPTLTRSRADWEQIDLAPYRTLLAGHDIRAIMVTHEMLPAVDPNLPTSLSPAVITGTLRGELGFNGVVISDDLHMRALAEQWPIATASVLAVEAGTDIVADLATPQEVRQTVDAFKAALASGKLPKTRIDASVQRILTLKIRMGLIPLPGPSQERPSRPLPNDGTVAQAVMYAERAGGLAGAA